MKLGSTFVSFLGGGSGSSSLLDSVSSSELDSLSSSSSSSSFLVGTGVADGRDAGRKRDWKGCFSFGVLGSEGVAEKDNIVSPGNVLFT